MREYKKYMLLPLLYILERRRWECRCWWVITYTDTERNDSYLNIQQQRQDPVCVPHLVSSQRGAAWVSWSGRFGASALSGDGWPRSTEPGTSAASSSPCGRHLHMRARSSHGRIPGTVFTEEGIHVVWLSFLKTQGMFHFKCFMFQDVKLVWCILIEFGQHF